MCRRKPDTTEVQQTKAQARGKRVAKKAEKILLQKEHQRREDVDRERRELEDRLI